MSVGSSGGTLTARRTARQPAVAELPLQATLIVRSTLLGRLGRCCLFAIAAVAALFLCIIAHEVYNDEDSALNGSILGVKGRLRVKLYDNSPHGHPSDGTMSIVSNLDGLLREASSTFSADIDRLFKADGSMITSLDVPGAGRSCLFDGDRCIFDGTVLVAVHRGSSFLPRADEQQHL